MRKSNIGRLHLKLASDNYRSIHETLPKDKVGVFVETKRNAITASCLNLSSLSLLHPPASCLSGLQLQRKLDLFTCIVKALPVPNRGCARVLVRPIGLTLASVVQIFWRLAMVFPALQDHSNLEATHYGDTIY